MGAIVAAICCFTPVLVVTLGVVGLGALTGYLDYVLFPALGVFLGMAVYGWIRGYRRACEACPPEAGGVRPAGPSQAGVEKSREHENTLEDAPGASRESARRPGANNKVMKEKKGFCHASRPWAGLPDLLGQTKRRRRAYREGNQWEVPGQTWDQIKSH